MTESFKAYEVQRVSTGNRHIVFFGQPFKDEYGNTMYVNITMNIGLTDPQERLRDVMLMGGLGYVEADGRYVFLPWPCASVEIREGDVPAQDGTGIM